MSLCFHYSFLHFFADEIVCFSQLKFGQEEVTQLANGLLQIGIGPGDRIGICLGNRYEWVTMFFAACKIGAVAVNINTAYREYEFKSPSNFNVANLFSNYFIRCCGNE